MGTHISRVKSVDLDSWTDEQLQSILKWGNSRANKYWEAKLAQGHVPSEAKIENFIRTKYELKRWVMDGPIPDPAILDAEGDDDVPLSVVKEKQNIDRRESVRKASVGKSAAPAPAPAPDLIGGDPVPLRASTTGPTSTRVPPKADPAPPKTTSTKDSLLGLDFLGGESATPPRPASTTGTSGSNRQSRPDLKQSILSLYAAAPRPQQPPQQQQQQQPSHSPSPTFGALQSPGHRSQSSTGGLNDAFSSLSFASSSQAKSPQRDAFSGLSSFGSNRSTPPPSGSSPFPNLSGGSFFDPKPAPAASKPSTQEKQPASGGSAFSALASPTLASPKPSAAAPPSSALGDLFDFTAPAAPAPAPVPFNPPINNSTPMTTTAPANSVFNLSASQPKPAPEPAPSVPLATMGSSLSGADVWGGNAWATPDPPKESREMPAAPTAPPANTFGWGGGGNAFAIQSAAPSASGGFAPKVAADEEFGGWASSTGPAPGGNTKPVGAFGTNEDLFSNVWE